MLVMQIAATVLAAVMAHAEHHVITHARLDVGRAVHVLVVAG